METICSVNANSLESYSVMHSGHHEDMISDFKTDNSYWGSVHYPVQGCLPLEPESHKQTSETTGVFTLPAGLVTGQLLHSLPVSFHPFYGVVEDHWWKHTSKSVRTCTDKNATSLVCWTYERQTSGCQWR